VATAKKGGEVGKHLLILTHFLIITFLDEVEKVLGELAAVALSNHLAEIDKAIGV
jgi:hypothetical protein